MASDVGAVSVIDAENGKRIWQERIDGLYTASPVVADGKVYFVSETGEVIVLSAGREPKLLARNDLGERLMASPAISNGQIFIRSDGTLFAIGRPRS
jgi:outer membrane protein assembly factor BamB